MASASSLLSEKHFLCSICTEVFTDPVSTPCGHNYCKACITHYWDSTGVRKCPLCNRAFKRRPEVCVNTLFSEMAQQVRSHKMKEEYEAKTEAEVQQMIQERREKIHQIQHSVELSRKDADREGADSVQVFTALISCIERSQAELIDGIEEKQKTTEKQDEGFIKELQEEIPQLEKRSSELKQISHSEDQPVQKRSWRPTKDWTKVNVHQSPHVGTVRTAVAQLEKTLSQETECLLTEMEKTLSQEMEKKLCDAELRRIQQYEVDVTLDPVTANHYLILSEDGRQVSCGNVDPFMALWHIMKNLPDNTERFSRCPIVLGKQSFSSGRFYYEVQVTGKTEWYLGVARESIERKGEITLSPNDGLWTVWLRNGNEYKACADPPVLLPVREELQKVGVFVDYEEGLVSFYDVEARVHLYSFTGCSFTEKLFPFFGPEPNDGGRNSAPLIISPVNHTSHETAAGGWATR